MNDDLTDYSKQFLKYLKLEAPELSCLMQPAKDEDGRYTRSLRAKIECPNKRVETPLSIATDDDEVTVGFDAFHMHFGGGEVLKSEERSFAKAIVFVRDVMDDRVLIASWWLDGKWCGVRVINAGDKPDRPVNVDPRAALHVRSWSGQKDQE